MWEAERRRNMGKIIQEDMQYVVNSSLLLCLLKRLQKIFSIVFQLFLDHELMFRSPCHIRVCFSWIHGLQGPVNHCILTQPQPLPFKVVEVVCKVRCKIFHINRKVLILGRVCMQCCPTELWMLMETFQI